MDFPFTQEQTLDILYKARDELWQPDGHYCYTCNAVNEAAGNRSEVTPIGQIYWNLLCSWDWPAKDLWRTIPPLWNSGAHGYDREVVKNHRFDLLTLAIVIAETDFSDFVSLLPE